MFYKDYRYSLSHKLHKQAVNKELHWNVSSHISLLLVKQNVILGNLKMYDMSRVSQIIC